MSIQGIEIHWDGDEEKVTDLRVIYNNEYDEEVISESVRDDSDAYWEMERLLDRIYEFFGEVWDPSDLKD